MHKLQNLKRINVIGTSGSGKSTFAREVARLLKLPYYEMDQLFWKSRWEKSADEEFFPKIREATSGPAWVLDGNYARTIPHKWKHVQTVIWLDLSFPRTIIRVTKRAIQRAFTQKELWAGTGNRETLARAFLSKESIIWWAITTHRRHRKQYIQMMASSAYAHISFVRLRSPKEVRSFLDSLNAEVSGGSASLGTEAVW